LTFKLTRSLPGSLLFQFVRSTIIAEHFVGIVNHCQLERLADRDFCLAAMTLRIAACGLECSLERGRHYDDFVGGYIVDFGHRESLETCPHLEQYIFA
jgi:hypothetical protein